MRDKFVGAQVDVGQSDIWVETVDSLRSKALHDSRQYLQRMIFYAHLVHDEVMTVIQHT